MLSFLTFVIYFIYNILAVIVSYLIGSLPAGYFLVKWREGSDIREIGSGSAGATNVSRILGKKGFVITFLLDFAKPLALLILLEGIGLVYEWQLAALLAMILGHIFPIFMKFRGGKGIAVYLGGTVILMPYLIIFSAVPMLLSYPFIKSFTLAGLIGISIGSIVYVFSIAEQSEATYVVSMLFLLLFSHRHNIKKFANGA